MIDTLTEADARAGRGASLLDRAVPDWFKRFDTETFDIMDPRHCAVGQALGLGGHGFNEASASYQQFIEQQITYNEIDYGFSAGWGLDDEGFYVGPQELEAAWLRAVTSRLMGSGI